MYSCVYRKLALRLILLFFVLVVAVVVVVQRGYSALIVMVIGLSEVQFGL